MKATAKKRPAKKRSVPLYSVGTWDMDEQAYTPQAGLSVPAFNIDIRQLRTALKELRRMGYPADRTRSVTNGYVEHDSDWAVLVERTDGMSEAEIQDGWRR